MDAENKLVINGIYEHYKGKRYQVIDTVRHSESLEELVLYKTLYENELSSLWVRPKELFLSLLENGAPRFKYVGDTPL